MSEYTGWSNVGGGSYQAAIDTVPTLPPGMYDTVSTQTGLYFIKDDESDRDIIRFPEAPIDTVVSELEDFWEKGEAFTSHGLPHKRGILLHGPPGSGKSCTLQLIVRDVIERGGLVFSYSGAFARAYHVLREVEPLRPLVVTMEDLDSIINPNNESQLLNVLDGIGEMHKVVFVATTNYPWKLGARIANRPSRFDRKVLVDHPNEESRRLYFETLMQPGDEVDVDLWVKGTAGLSLAHLKELFVAVCILENDYKESLKVLREMKETQETKAEETGHAGFL